MLNEDTRLLLARCRRGDAEAQSELLCAIQPRLYFYCLKMLKDERRAQEIERKIFCEVLNGLSELKNDEDFPLRTVSTAARLCRAAARNAAPEQADSAPFIDGPAQVLPDKALDSEENRCLTAALTAGTGVRRENFLWVALYISFVNSLLEEFFFRPFPKAR